MTSLKNATRTALSPLGDEARISGTSGLGGGFCSRLPFRIATSVRLTGTPSENEMPATEPEGSMLAASRDKSNGILSGLRGLKNLITPSLAKLYPPTLPLEKLQAKTFGRSGVLPCHGSIRKLIAVDRPLVPGTWT